MPLLDIARAHYSARLLINMTIHSIYIFSKSGTCLYYNEWVRPRSTLSDTPEEDRKLMFGLLFSLKQLMNKLAPVAASSTESSATFTGSSVPGTPVPAKTPIVATTLPPMGPDQGFYKFACSHYVLHHLETPTGYRFALTTDPGATDLRNALWHIYSELFVGYALKNPMYTPGTPIAAAGFIRELDVYIRSLPTFSSGSASARAS